MSAFVIDASISAAWFLPDEKHPAAERVFSRLAHDMAVAPGLWWFEVRNIFIVSERRGRIGAEQTTRALRLLQALPVSLDHEAEEQTTLDLARRHNLSVYDAAYLELAIRRRLTLATLDGILARAATKEEIAVVGN